MLLLGEVLGTIKSKQSLCDINTVMKNDNSYISWSMHCTNLDCGFFFTTYGNEPDAVCNRCGTVAEINEKIIIEKNKDDLRSK